MNQFNKSLIVLGLIIGAPQAIAEISGNATIASDYVFRGVSQSAENLAIQVGLDYSHESGFYAGTWGSNVDFYAAQEAGDNDESVELDFYLGFAGSFGESGVDYDASYLYYTYPGSISSISYGEFVFGLSYQDLSLQYAYSSDLFATDATGQYISAAYDFTLPQDITLSLQAGYSFGNAFDSNIDNSATGLPEYSDFSISLAKTLNGFDLSLSYIDTDISGDFVIKQDHLANDGRLIVTIAKSF